MRAATATTQTSATGRSSEWRADVGSSGIHIEPGRVVGALRDEVDATSDLVDGLERLVALRAEVEEQGPCILDGFKIKRDLFKGDMWESVSTNHNSAGDAGIIQLGLDEGFSFGIDESLISGVHVRPNYASADEHRELVDKALCKRLAAGKTMHLGKLVKGWRSHVVSAVGPTFKCFSLGAVLKKLEIAARPISDHTASGLNDAVNIAWLAYSCRSHAAFKRMFKPGFWAAISDIADAFLILPLKPTLWKYFMFRWYGQTEETKHEMHLYVHLFADFGCAGVPAIFDVFMRVVIGMARHAGALTLPHAIHVDDMAIAGANEDNVNHEQLGFADYVEGVGVYIKRPKLLLAAQSQVFIGFHWNSITRALELPEAKLHEYLDALVAFAGQSSATRKQAESLGGKLLRGILTLPPGANCLLANLWAFTRGLNTPGARRRTTKALVADLMDVKDLLQANEGKGYFAYDAFPRATQVFSDASASRKKAAGGYVSACGRYRWQPYGVSAARKPIDYLEGDWVTTAAEDIAPLNKGCLIPFGIDNSSFQLSAKKGWSRAQRLQVLVRRLFHIAIDNQCVFEYEWLSSFENLFADLLSRDGEVEFLAIIEASGFIAAPNEDLWAHVTLRRHPETGKVKRFIEPIKDDPDTTSLEPDMSALNQASWEYPSNPDTDGAPGGGFSRKMTVHYPPASLFEGLPEDECEEIDRILNSRYKDSSHRSINMMLSKWDECRAQYARKHGVTWDRLIHAGDPQRGAKSAVFLKYLMADTSLVWASIENILWSFAKWHELKREADPLISVLGWEHLTKGVMVLTAVPREPRAELPLDVLRRALQAVDTSVFWEVQSAFLQLLTFFTFVRSETPLPKTYESGQQPFDAAQHWQVRDITFGSDPELHLKARLKDIKQATAADRPGGSDDWIYLGLVPEDYEGGIWSLARWYRLLMAFYPEGRPDPTAPFFLDREQARWYTYNNALTDARRLWVRGTKSVEWNDYGLHGLRVLGYNRAVEGVGELLTACHGRWALDKASGPAHRQYRRFTMAQILLIPFAMLGLVPPDDVEEPTGATAPARSAAQRFFEEQPLSRGAGATRHTVTEKARPTVDQVVTSANSAVRVEAVSQADDVYAVDKILAERTKRRKKEYLIRWEGYGSEHDTWEPAANVGDPGLIADFDARMARAVPPLGEMLDSLAPPPPLLGGLVQADGSPAYDVLPATPAPPTPPPRRRSSPTSRRRAARGEFRPTEEQLTMGGRTLRELM